MRPCGCGLSRINPPRLTTLARGSPLEPPPRHPREKAAWSAALEAPSTLKPPPERAPESRYIPFRSRDRSAAPSIDRTKRTSTPTPFQPTTSPALTSRSGDGSVPED
jgi:hypothetical protein